MSLHSLVAATGESPYNINNGGNSFPPVFGTDAPAASPRTPEERRQHLIQMINSALAVVDEFDLGVRTSAEEQPRRPRRHQEDCQQKRRRADGEKQQPPQQ